MKLQKFLEFISLSVPVALAGSGCQAFTFPSHTRISPSFELLPRPTTSRLPHKAIGLDPVGWKGSMCTWKGSTACGKISRADSVSCSLFSIFNGGQGQAAGKRDRDAKERKAAAATRGERRPTISIFGSGGHKKNDNRTPQASSKNAQIARQKAAATESTRDKRAEEKMKAAEEAERVSAELATAAVEARKIADEKAAALAKIRKTAQEEKVAKENAIKARKLADEKVAALAKARKTAQAKKAAKAKADTRDRKIKSVSARQSLPLSGIAKAPRGVPTVVDWRQRRDGGISGRICGFPNDGERVETSKIEYGTIKNNSVVMTGSGSRYFLAADIPNEETLMKSAKPGATII